MVELIHEEYGEAYDKCIEDLKDIKKQSRDLVMAFLSNYIKGPKQACLCIAAGFDPLAVEFFLIKSMMEKSKLN